MNSVRSWLHGLGAAFVGSFSTAAVGALTLPGVFNFSHDGLINFAKVCVLPGLVSAFGYLRQSPLPSSTVTVTATQSKTVTITPEEGKQ
jgi:hypothetical protein